MTQTMCVLVNTQSAKKQKHSIPNLGIGDGTHAAIQPSRVLL